MFSFGGGGGASTRKGAGNMVAKLKAQLQASNTTMADVVAITTQLRSDLTADESTIVTNTADI